MRIKYQTSHYIRGTSSPLRWEKMVTVRTLESYDNSNLDKVPLNSLTSWCSSTRQPQHSGIMTTNLRLTLVYESTTEAAPPEARFCPNYECTWRKQQGIGLWNNTHETCRYKWQVKQKSGHLEEIGRIAIGGDEDRIPRRVHCCNNHKP